jgi:hypothetical protein
MPQDSWRASSGGGLEANLIMPWTAKGASLGRFGWKNASFQAESAIVVKG